MGAASGARRPGSVLFVCAHNVVRSPVAAALTRYYYPRSVYAESAGVRPGRPDQFAAEVMSEIGLDISRHYPRSLDDLDDTNFDLVVTLAPEAHHAALELTRTHAIDVEYWPTPDPSRVEGSREQVLEAYRTMRDDLTRTIRRRFAQ